MCNEAFDSDYKRQLDSEGFKNMNARIHRNCANKLSGLALQEGESNFFIYNYRACAMVLYEHREG